MRASILVALVFCCVLSAPAATLPSGFEEVRIASGLDPTSMSFAPDGRLLVTEKAGRIWVIKNSAILATPLVDLRARCDNYGERGLMSVAFDPQFVSNGYVYVYYTYTTNKNDTSHTSSRNRVSRFTVSGDVAAAAETVIFEINQLSSSGNHNGGGLRFGKDGKLYVSTGENTTGANAQNSGNLLGKLLRLNANGTIPTDNPNYASFSGNNRAIVALGLRNPFTMAVQRTTGLLYINDVGGGGFEEVNRYDTGDTGDTGSVPTKANYGWPVIEGKRTSQTAPADYRDPAQAYGRSAGYCICGGDFYNPSTTGSSLFPGGYSGRYFFTDYSGWIKYIDPANPGSLVGFASGIPHPIDVEVAADGTLWYIARGNAFTGGNTATSDGAVWRVRYTGTVQTATRLAITQQPSAVGAGSAITPAVKVTVQDAAGITVTGSSATVTIAIGTNPTGAVLSGTVSVAAVNGVATFSNLMLNKAGTGYTLKATSGSLASATSAMFNVLGQVATPTITPPSGTFTGPVWMQLATATSGATIRYTIDGTSPTTSSPIYSVPFQLTSTRTVRAIALVSGLTTSATAVASLSISGSTPYGLDFRPPLTGMAMPSAVSSSLPATLGATGLFTDVGSLVTKKALIPFTVNSPLWSDNADKRRWVGLPGNAKVIFAPTGEYVWPGGTVFVKHFELEINEVTKAKRRLETRVLVLDASGGNGYGVTYRWRADNSDADLVGTDGADQVLAITTSSGSRNQTWHYPSRSECLQCHTTVAGFVLGPKTRQLNGTYAYPGGASDNQVRTWNYLRMFNTEVSESAIAGYHRLVKVDDSSATLEKRVRSYLDANCANCHRPNGVVTMWDGRFDTPLADQGIINGVPRDSLGISGAHVVTPKDLVKSLMHLRLKGTDMRKMPPLARNLVDTKAVAALESWIASLPAGSGLKGEYWTNQAQTFTGSPTVTRTDPQINFAWGTAAPASGVSADLFTTRWTGKLVPAYGETYRFFTESDDGVRLWINNQLIVDKWVPQGPTEHEGTTTVALTAGQLYDVKMEYFERYSGALAKLRWSSPSLPKSIVPQYRLFPSAAAASSASATLTFTSIALSPANVTVVDGGSVAYVAKAKDQNGDDLVPQPAITWSVSGGGTISSAGVFSATTAGSFTVIAQATVASVNQTSTTGVTVTNPIAAKINFQPASAPTADGYAVDAGLIYADRGNGLTYGWSADVSTTARDRNLNGDQARDTLLHLQKPVAPDAQWEIAVPNGTYAVFLVCGDAAANLDADYRVQIEGTLAVSGIPTSATRFFDSGSGFRVVINDGRLTMSSASGALNNKVCFIEIVQIPVVIQ